MNFNHISAICNDCKKPARTVGVSTNSKGYLGIEYVCSCRKAGIYVVDLQDFMAPDALTQRRLP